MLLVGRIVLSVLILSASLCSVAQAYPDLRESQNAVWVNDLGTGDSFVPIPVAASIPFVPRLEISWRLPSSLGSRPSYGTPPEPRSLSPPSA